MRTQGACNGPRGVMAQGAVVVPGGGGTGIGVEAQGACGGLTMWGCQRGGSYPRRWETQGKWCWGSPGVWS